MKLRVRQRVSDAKGSGSMALGQARASLVLPDNRSARRTLDRAGHPGFYGGHALIGAGRPRNAVKGIGVASSATAGRRPRRAATVNIFCP